MGINQSTSSVLAIFKDEDGTFRDPAFDPVRKKLPETPSSPPKTHISEANDLEEFRTVLQEQYPFHAKEIEASGLLQPSRLPYADTNSKNTLMRAHRQMVRLREMDTIFQNVQRQGRISFYMTCHGEEVSQGFLFNFNAKLGRPAVKLNVYLCAKGHSFWFCLSFGPSGHSVCAISGSRSPHVERFHIKAVFESMLLQ